MVRRGMTEKPCHGCGTTVLHGTDELCRDCKTLLEIGRRVREEQQSSKDNQVILVNVPKGAHGMSRPYLFCQAPLPCGTDFTRRLEQAWHRLALAVTKPGTQVQTDKDLVTNKKVYNLEHRVEVGWGLDGERSYDPRQQRIVDKDVYEALNAYDALQRLVLEFCYRCGYEEGGNILARLNQGDLAVNDFEKQGDGNRLKLMLLLEVGNGNDQPRRP
ncbi:MAG: hypothetical protein HY675_25595 [Chloroflexi bacterium]|nr:hypothetical protein [Chloroflexota bacterium]